MKMKLYTEKGNLNTLKLLAAAEESGIKLEVIEKKHGEKVVPYLTANVLPVLEVYPGKFLFSPNSATRYISNKKAEETDADVDKWLEWESSQLQPVLYPYLVSVIGSGKPETGLLIHIQTLLKSLNGDLKGKKFLSEVGLSAADFVLWGSLYPLLAGKFVLKGWEGLYPKIKGWFTAMCDLPSCQKAVTLVITNGDTASLKESLLSQPAPLPLPHLKNIEKLEKVKVDDKVKVKVEKAAEPEEIQVISQKAVTKEELSAAVDAWNSGKSKCPKPLKRKHPILPKEGERNILITSALPYVNNVPHLGNIIGCVLSADVFSRYCRLRGYNCLYVCGTDEYGTATETKAIEEKLTPQQICDKYNKLHTEIYDWFNIDCDFFGRTTTKEQTSIAQDIFWKLYNQGFILKDSIDQLHCTACDRFLADRFVEGTCPLCTYEDARGDQCDKCGKLINAVDLRNPKCKLCKATPVIKSTQHLFLDLPKIEPQLQKHLDKVFKSGTWTNNAKVITSSWIRDGLKPRCISRDLKWGTQVPLSGYTDKVFYVWFDAPIGYISITANYTEHWEQWWKNPDKVDMYNFLGKDNVPFHSVIFPCTMLGANDNYTVVKHMIATEYLNYEDGKFSKSRGTGVFGNQAQDTGLPADIFRFYLLYVRPESQDSSFSWDDFLLKNNSELLNNLGNFINRGLKFLSDNFGGVIQEMNLKDEDKELLALINRELQTYIDNMEQAILRDSIRNIMSISRLGNQFMQSNKPWVLVKGSADDKSRSGTVVSLAVNIANLLSVLLQPYMPETSQTIQTQLNTPPDSNVVYREFVCHLPPGHRIGKPSPLFQKIEACKIEEFKKMFAGQPAPETKTKRGEKTAVSGSGANGPVNNAEVQRLTDEVTKQGLVVRDLKSKKAEKSLIDSEVAKLLDLKKRLAAVSVPASNGAGNNAEVERLTDEVTKQGLVVRDLKSKKAEKSLIDSEVAKLLDLKKRLASAQGQNPQEAVSGGKKKGKKK
ncbi:methionine--tRNA ligase, cytoplasmic-like isoform X3 [Mytilus trossulus]|uniref:methionine--tRNA ligase, cytoplasmic-like isoform X3 n=1 Tax=Mytilus trossulus TaxID=6551 RepID=UPI003004A30A